MYWFLWVILRGIFRVIFKWKISGLENLPPEGPVVICANHRSWWDPPVIGCSVNRKLHYMAKEELFRIPLFGRIIRTLGAFPVRRHSPDRRAMREAIAILESGGAVLMFPEGTRRCGGCLGPPEPGAALMALKTGSPVVPVGISGHYRLLGLVRVRIGRPLRFENVRSARREELSLASRRIMESIAVLLGKDAGPE